MAVSTLNATLPCEIEKVWETVTNLKEFAWRSDLENIEVLSENQFVEYAKGGFSTTFTITLTEKYKRWEFDMENQNMKGHWIGVFTRQGSGTEIEFTEDVTPKKVWMKPFIKSYLRKQQALYLADLEKAML